MALTSVLVLRALGLGDFVAGLPALRALRREFSSARITLAAPPALEPLVMLSRAVDELVAVQALAPVGVERPDIAVNLHGRGPQSHRVLLATRPRRLIAFEHAEVPESRGSPPWLPEEHEVDRWCRLLDQCGIVAQRTELSLPTPSVQPPAAAAGATLIHPGAASPARRWPADRWAAVARAEVDAGRRVAVSAGPGELGLAAEIAGRAGLGEDSIIAGDLLTMAATVAAARVVASGDTGVAHLATALGTPSVVLFGPVSPAQWGPPKWHRHVALWAGRVGDPHAMEPDPGLLSITVEQVVAALRALRDGARPLNRRLRKTPDR